MVGQESVHSSNSITSYLTPGASNIIMALFDQKTKLAYWRVWCRFRSFCNGHWLSKQLPISVVLLLNFSTSLYQLGYQLSTIASMLSAIAFIHKILGYSDPTSTF